MTMATARRATMRWATTTATMATGDDVNDVDGDSATGNEVDDDGDGATGNDNDDDNNGNDALPLRCHCQRPASQDAKVDLKPLIVSVIPIYCLSDTMNLFCVLFFILLNKLITFSAS
jgi:hypothetical protein